MQQSRNLVLIAQDSIQNSLLRNFLKQQLECECVLLDSVTAFRQKFADDDGTLVLLEVPGNKEWPIDSYISLICKWHRNCQIALYNATDEIISHKLLDWPQIRGVFTQDQHERLLVCGLQRIFGGEYWLPRKLMTQFIDSHRRPVTELTEQTVSLTKRELMILTLICDGLSNTAIAVDLNLSEHTVKTHVYNIFRKLNVTNRVQAANQAKKVLAVPAQQPRARYAIN